MVGKATQAYTKMNNKKKNRIGNGRLSHREGWKGLKSGLYGGGEEGLSRLSGNKKLN